MNLMAVVVVQEVAGQMLLVLAVLERLGKALLVVLQVRLLTLVQLAAAVQEQLAAQEQVGLVVMVVLALHHP